LPYKNASPSTKAALEGALSRLPPSEALSDRELFVALGPAIDAEALAFLKRELWRARVAALAYSRVRSMGAHWFASPSAVSFSTTTHRGTPLPEIDFAVLRSALLRIIDYADALSARTNKWFGHA